MEKHGFKVSANLFCLVILPPTTLSHKSPKNSKKILNIAITVFCFCILLFFQDLKVLPVTVSVLWQRRSYRDIKGFFQMYLEDPRAKCLWQMHWSFIACAVKTYKSLLKRVLSPDVSAKKPVFSFMGKRFMAVKVRQQHSWNGPYYNCFTDAFYIWARWRTEGYISARKLALRRACALQITRMCWTPLSKIYICLQTTSGEWFMD